MPGATLSTTALGVLDLTPSPVIAPRRRRQQRAQPATQLHDFSGLNSKMISLIHIHHLTPIWFHVSIWCVPPSLGRALCRPAESRKSDAPKSQTCRLWLCVPPPPPMPCVAIALANCLTGQPLKTTLGLCCCPAGTSMVHFSLFALLNFIAILLY
jgi:hypothetical protein